MISQYWIDQIPARPLSIQVRTQSGEDANLSAYTNIEAVMVGSNNEEIDLTGSVLDTAGKSIGNIIFRWPTTRSLFEYPGDYVLQLKLSGTGRLDFTSTHTLRVRELGRTNR
jgi:glyoxylase-like metal-dependent hydrolase (beta-lactamase superfamily II)